MNILDILNDELLLFIATICSMFLDVGTGIIKGFSKNDFASQKMREGFWHKSANIILLCMSYGIYVLSQYSDAVPGELGTTYIFIGGYLLIMEVSSIFENLVEINPELARPELIARFRLSEKLQKENENDTEE